MLTTPSDFAVPFAHTSGPRDARIAIVGEAWGEQEELTGRPFQGTAGRELNEMLRVTGIARNTVFCTNTLVGRPPKNDITEVLVKRAGLPPGTDPKTTLYKTGWYWPPTLQPHLDRLQAELREVRPNVIVALGATASFALLGSAAIGSIRGVAALGPLGIKTIPTYHPSAILRQWNLRVVALMDLKKALRESTSPDLHLASRRITINPTLQEVQHFAARPHPRLAVDIETGHGEITMIGFAPSPHEALVVPFFGHPHYWPSTAEECTAWAAVQTLLRSPCPKILQNGLYDIQWLWRLGLQVRNVVSDTMLYHHALYSEQPKSLGFLGSLYTNEVAWKLARAKHNITEKKDE